MRHHPIFEGFPRVKCIGTGKHVFDFLGVATDVLYKREWQGHAVKRGWQCQPDYPVVNEHYFGWIGVLGCIQSGSGIFRMAELGAGWAPWLVRAAFAARQNSSITGLELVGIEADSTHYDWMRDHFLDNELNPDKFQLLHGAVSPKKDLLRFPRIINPDQDYGASASSFSQGADYVEVRGYTLSDLFGRFSGPIDLIQMDIQGTEYDVLPDSMTLLKSSAKAVIIETHISLEKHNELHQLFLDEGWEPVMAYARNAYVATDYGRVQFGDGFLHYRNGSF